MLSPEIQSVLHVLACFGVLEKKEVSILESNLSMDLSQPLQSAIDEGYVCIKNASYCFSHDKFMEAVYCMVPLEERRCQHLKYGRCLATKALENRNDRLLFTAVNQLHLAGSSLVTDPVESANFALFNMISGQRAIAMCNYTFADSHFKSARSFLNESHWQSHYNICIDLSKLAAKSALVLGDFNHLAALAQEVDMHALCFGDKFSVKLAVMISLAYTKHIRQSVSAGLSILRQLGHELSTTWSRDDILFHTKETQKELSSIYDLLNYEKMEEPRHKMAMECLAEMQLTTLLANPNLQVEITLKMIYMTLHLGLCRHTPVALAYYAGEFLSSYFHYQGCFSHQFISALGLLGKLGEMKMRDAHRFAKLARSLLEQEGNSREIAGKIDKCQWNCSKGFSLLALTHEVFICSLSSKR